MFLFEEQSSFFDDIVLFEIVSKFFTAIENLKAKIVNRTTCMNPTLSRNELKKQKGDDEHGR